MIDDIEDSSTLRRGRPAAHIVYGLPRTLNCANHVYFLCLQEVLRMNSASAVQVFTHALVELHQGQGKDIYWRDEGIVPTLDEYEQMVVEKTGGLFNLAMGLLRTASKFNDARIDILMNEMAFFFQVLDDYLNLQSDEYHDNKSYAEDLTEGKFSYPIIHSIQEEAKTGQKSIKQFLAKHSRDESQKREIVRRIEDLGSLDYTRKVLLARQERISRLITDLGGNRHMEVLNATLCSALQNSSPK